MITELDEKRLSQGKGFIGFGVVIPPRYERLQKARREIAENTNSINYKNYSECPNCWGTGWFKGADCTWCSGKGLYRIFR